MSPYSLDDTGLSPNEEIHITQLLGLKIIFVLPVKTMRQFPGPITAIRTQVC